MGEKKVAVISVIIENTDSAEKVNVVLHDYGEYIVCRTGLPYRQRGISIITAVVDAEQEIINGITGKLGMIKDVTAKALTRNL